MTKILVTADIHAHQFEAFSKPTEYGYNSRLEAILKVFIILEATARTEKCDVVYIAGDLFHTRKFIDVVTYNAVYEALLELSRSFPVYILIGNHDCALKDSIHPLGPIGEIKDIHIIDTPTDHRIGDITVASVPYIADPVILKEKILALEDADVFFGHFACAGALTAKALYPMQEGINIGETAIAKKFKHMYLGDFHNHQQMTSNCYYVGAPIQHNFGDSEDEKVLAIYDSTKKETKWINVTVEFPNFKEFILTNDNLVEYAKWLKTVDSNDYVKLIDRNCKHQIDFLSAFPDSILIKEAPQDNTSRINITEDMSFETIMKEYIGATDTELDKKRLLKVGKELLQ